MSTTAHGVTIMSNSNSRTRMISKRFQLTDRYIGSIFLLSTIDSKSKLGEIKVKNDF